MYQQCIVVSESHYRSKYKKSVHFRTQKNITLVGKQQIQINNYDNINKTEAQQIETRTFKLVEFNN